MTKETTNNEIVFGIATSCYFLIIPKCMSDEDIADVLKTFIKSGLMTNEIIDQAENIAMDLADLKIRSEMFELENYDAVKVVDNSLCKKEQEEIKLILSKDLKQIKSSADISEKEIAMCFAIIAFHLNNRRYDLYHAVENS